MEYAWTKLIATYVIAKMVSLETTVLKWKPRPVTLIHVLTAESVTAQQLDMSVTVLMDIQDKTVKQILMIAYPTRVCMMVLVLMVSINLHAFVALATTE